MKDTTRIEVRLSPTQMETLTRFSTKLSAQDGIYNLAEVFQDFKLGKDDLHSLYKLLDFLKDFKEIPAYSGMSLSFFLSRLPGIILVLACTQNKEPDINHNLELKSFGELLEICRENKEKYYGFSKFLKPRNKDGLVTHIRACNSLMSDSDSNWIG
ncbi:hypothetical protein BI308_23145 [Roseofilum reptotaenium AO1-A]|uniref:Uncharacterized protein n=1 Tax=Roseofilum reptotaenium AO1-A TaxID=1925591 RepID=A0A1L9QKJ7_9CYAN|nr:hypothetical protein BI308_23145 [Roseofilum reptotaenium AO1-A]